jgi:hypothetical protein
MRILVLDIVFRRPHLSLWAFSGCLFVFGHTILAKLVVSLIVEVIILIGYRQQLGQGICRSVKMNGLLVIIILQNRLIQTRINMAL